MMLYSSEQVSWRLSKHKILRALPVLLSRLREMKYCIVLGLLYSSPPIVLCTSNPSQHIAQQPFSDSRSALENRNERERKVFKWKKILSNAGTICKWFHALVTLSRDIIGRIRNNFNQRQNSQRAHPRLKRLMTLKLSFFRWKTLRSARKSFAIFQNVKSLKL